MGTFVVAVVLAGVATLAVLPDRLGIDERTPFVQVVAFRPQLSVGLLVVAVLVLAARRRAWPVAVALGLVAVVGLAIVVPRATADAPAASSPDRADTGSLTVLTVNTYLGRADPAALAALVRQRSPDVVALPEAGGELRRRLAQALDDDQGGIGYRSFAADSSSDDSPMTVLVALDRGRPTVTVDRSTEFPSIVVELRGGTRVVATHPEAPKPGNTYAWRRDVAALARWCSEGADGRPTVVAGDLNATFDHAELRSATAGCSDAAAEVGEGLTGTWPSGLPRLLGAQIDHVLLSGGPRAQAVEVVDVEGSDHRGVLARVSTG